MEEGFTIMKLEKKDLQKYRTLINQRKSWEEKVERYGYLQDEARMKKDASQSDIEDFLLIIRDKYKIPHGTCVVNIDTGEIKYGVRV